MDEKLTPSRVCNIKTQTQRADLIRNAYLIIWDELPMTHRYCVEALERSLRDITRQNKLFGGKSKLLPGYWRQIGPVSKIDSPTDVVDMPSFQAPYGNTSTGFGLQNHNEIKKSSIHRFRARYRREQNQPYNHAWRPNSHTYQCASGLTTTFRYSPLGIAFHRRDFYLPGYIRRGG